MPGLSYSVSVDTPCSGEQLVNKISTNLYGGSGGDFNYALLTIPPSGNAWLVTIYDYSGSACTPTKTYEQVNGNASDPTGAYGLDGPNGPDPTLGQLSVTAWP